MIRITSAILAAAVALTSITATPAAAGNKDFEKFLLGAGTILILGSILNENNRNRGYAVTPKIVTQTNPKVVIKPTKPAKVIKQTRWLPKHCERRIATAKGPFHYMERRCLIQNAPRMSLPNGCLRRVDGINRDFTVYGSRCLRGKGFHF